MIRVEGLNATLNVFRQFGDAVFKAIGNEAKASALTIARNAKRNAPANHGALRRRITVNQIDEVTFEVVSNANYSAYIEFGTKAKVRVPPEFQAIAAAARGRGMIGGLSAREAIFNWCRQRGIPERAWWPIYISIMKEGIRPQPFLVPAYEEEQRHFLNRLRNIIQGR